MAMANPNNFHGSTSTILWESFKLPFKNSSLFFLIILLSLLFSSPSLFFLPKEQYVYLVLARPIPVRLTDLLDLIGSSFALTTVNCIFLILNFLFTSSLTTLIICALSTTHTGKDPILKDVIFRTKRSWKWSFVSQVCITLLHLGFIVSVAPVLLGFAIISQGSVLLVVLLTLLAIFPVFYYLQTTVASLVYLIVSATEDESYGMAAIVRALELISTSWKQGIVVSLLMVTLSSAATLVLNLVFYSSHPDGIQMGIGFIRICIDVVLNLIILATSTVLHFECTRREGKENVAEMEGYLANSALLINDIGEDLL